MEYKIWSKKRMEEKMSKRSKKGNLTTQKIYVIVFLNADFYMFMYM